MTKLPIERQYTRWINWGLDNLLPPIIRESGFFLTPLMRLVLGERWREFAQFKEKAPSMSPEEIQAVYGRLASSHLPRETDLHPACLQLILEKVVGQRILDVGCGRGFLANRLYQKNSALSICGVDMGDRPRHMESAIDFYQGMADALPFDDQAFDTVICSHVLEHTLRPVEVVQELRRVAKKKLIIVVPRQRPYKYTFDLHVQFFPHPHSLDLLMGAQGGTTRSVGGDLYFEEEVLC